MAGQLCKCGRRTVNGGGECTSCLTGRRTRRRKLTETSVLPPAEIPAHEARIEAHRARVALELARLNRHGKSCA